MQIVLPVVDYAIRAFGIIWAIALTLPLSSYLLTVRYSRYPRIYEMMFSSDMRCYLTCIVIGSIGTLLSMFLNLTLAPMFLVLTLVLSFFTVGLVIATRGLRK